LSRTPLGRLLTVMKSDEPHFSRMLLDVEASHIEIDLYRPVDATLHGAEGPPVIVIVPGAASKNWHGYRALCEPLAMALADAGFSSLNFAARGQEPCPGTWSLQSMLTDLGALLHHLRSTGLSRIGLLAYSAGTSVALAYVLQDPNWVRSVAMWGTCFSPFYASFYSDIAEARRRLAKLGTRISDDFRVPSSMMPEHLLPSVTVPLLLAFGTEDQYSSISDQLTAFTRSASSRSEFVVIKNATHAITSAHPAFPDLIAVFRSWFFRTL